MLIIDTQTRKPRTERLVTEWLSNYITHPGVAVSGVHVPNSQGRATEADFVVFTPYAAVVIEVKGLRKRAGGMLMCSMNERWSLRGVSGDPVHVHQRDLNPLHQVREPVFDLKNLAAGPLGWEPFVDGLVVVIPFPHRPIRLDRGSRPAGFDVLRGNDAAQLYSWFNRTARYRTASPWTADTVLNVLSVLRVDGTGDRVRAGRLYDELLAEGFAAGVSALGRPWAGADPAAPAPAPYDSSPQTFSQLPPGVTASAPAPRAIPPTAPARQSADADHTLLRPTTDGPPATPVTERSDESDAARRADLHTARYEYAEEEPRPQNPARPPQHRLRTAILAITAVMLLACGFWYLSGHDDARAQNNTSVPATSNAPTRPTAEHTPARPPATETRPARRTPHLFPDETTCYPFQSGC